MVAGSDPKLEAVWTTIAAQAKASGKPDGMTGVIEILRERSAQKQLDTQGRKQLGALLHGFAELVKRRGDIRGAVAGFAEAAAYFREAGDQSLLQGSLGQQADALMELDDYQGAVPLVAERAQICREIDDKPALLSTLQMQGRLLHWSGDAEHATELAEQAEALAREIGGDDGVALSMANRGLVLISENKLDEAEPLLERAVAMLRGGSNKTLLANTIGGYGVVLMQRGDFEKSLALQHEAASIARESGDAEGLAKALTMQALVLIQMGRSAEGVPLAREADALARARGLTSLANQVVGPVLSMLGASAEEAPVAPRPAASSPSPSRDRSSPVAPAAPRERSADEQKADYLFELNRWQKLSLLQRLRTKKPELPASMRTDWRTDPLLKGRFHKDAIDDIEVLVHDGHYGICKRPPERIWVRVNGRRDGTWTGTLLNQPFNLQSVKLGSEIQFVATSRTQPLVHVTPKYLEERRTWTVGPCTKCGLTETFSPPSELLALSDAPAAARAQIKRLTAACPICEGMQTLVRS